MFKGSQIRTKREALGLSAGELASMLDISKANLYKWEKGHMPSNPKDYLKVERWLTGKVESVPQNDTTTTEMPQKDAKTKPHIPTTRIGKAVWDVQYATGMTIEQVADRIGYSRQHLNPLMKEGDSAKVWSKLQSEFGDILNTNSQVNTQPEPKADKYLMELMDYLKRDKEWFQKQFETSLVGLALGQKAIAARVETILDKDNERDAGGNKKKEQQLKEETDRRIGEKFQAARQMDNTLNR